MRWPLLFLLNVLFLPWGWSAGSTSQEADSIYITERFVNTDLITVFSTLEKKYGLRLAYDETAVADIRVSCRLDRVEVRQAFELLLRGTPLDFRVVDEHHVMIRRNAQGQGYNESPPDVESATMTLRGRVVDGLTGQALPYASIAVSARETGVETDADGAFRLTLSLPLDDIAMQVQYLGYYPRIVRLEETGSAASLTITLHPRILEIPGILVKEQAPVLSSSSQWGRLRLDAAALGMVPGFVGGKDLFRTLQLLPGIGAADDLSAGLQIRGGDSGDNLVLLDGMTLYRVDHFYGVFSAVNPEIIGHADLYKSAFPARFGGRTAGVLEMSSRSLDNLRPEGSAELNLLTSNANLTLPVAPGLHLLLGGRVSNGDISDTQLFDLANQERTATPDRGNLMGNRLTTLSRDALLAQTPDFRFYDTNARMVWAPRSGSSLAANFFRSYDRYGNDYQNSFTNQFRRRVTNTEVYNEKADWSNTGFSLQGEHRWSERQTTYLNLAQSSFRNDNNLFAALIRSEVLRSDTVGIANVNNNGIAGTDLHLRQEWNLGADRRLSAGWQSQHHHVDYRLGVDNADVLRDTQAAWEHTLYSEWDGRLSDSWSLRAGLRGTYYQPANNVYLSPRLALHIDLPAGFGLQASWSRYYQFLREIDYENRFGTSQPFFLLAGDRFPVARANLWTFGVQYTHPRFSVEAEYFDRHTDGALEYALLLTGFQNGQEAPARQLNYVSFVGKSRTYGLDMLLRKTSGRYTGWIAYTLSKSTNSFPEILRGQEYPASNDRRHQLKIVNQYRLKQWQFSATYVFASGRPYSNLADLARLRLQPADRRELPIEDRLSYLADYHRLDVGVTYDIRIGATSTRLGISCFNLLDNVNVKYRQYLFSIPEAPIPSMEQNTVIGNELQLLGRTLNLSVGISF